MPGIIMNCKEVEFREAEFSGRQVYVKVRTTLFANWISTCLSILYKILPQFNCFQELACNTNPEMGPAKAVVDKWPWLHQVQEVYSFPPRTRPYYLPQSSSQGFALWSGKNKRLEQLLSVDLTSLNGVIWEDRWSSECSSFLSRSVLLDIAG